MADKLYMPCDYGYLCEPVEIGDAEFDTTIPDWEWTAEIPTSGDTPTSASVEGLDWLSVELDGDTLRLSGTPTEAGTYSFTVTVTNCPELGDTSDTKTFTMTVDPAVEFRYTVAPEEEGELSYCPVAPSYLSSGRLYVDWGDGSREIVPASGSDTFPTHEYATSDGTNYQITLSATGETWAGVSSMFFGSSTTVSLSTPEPDGEEAAAEEDADDAPQVLATKTTPADQSACHVRYLVGVDDPLPYMGFTTGAYMFYNNRLLESVPNDLFSARASEYTSFASCFYYCLSLKCPSNELFKNCTAATSFDHCFYYCQNLDSETNFPANFLSGCTAMESAVYCFCGAWLGNVTSPLFGGLPSLTDVCYCFDSATFGDVSAPLLDDLPALTTLVGGATSSNRSYGISGATFGAVSAPILGDLPALTSITSYSYGNFAFYNCTFDGDITSSLFGSLPSMASTGSGSDSGFFSSCTFNGAISETPTGGGLSALASVGGSSSSSYAAFYNCTFNGAVSAPLIGGMPAIESINKYCFASCKFYGTVSSPLISNLSALTSITTVTGGGVFYSCTFGDISAAIISNLSALTTLSGGSGGVFRSCTFGDINVPIFSDLPKLTTIGDSTYGGSNTFHSCKFNGDIKSAIFSGLSALTQICDGDGNNAVFYSCTLGDINVPIFSNLSALTKIGGAASYCDGNVFFGGTIGTINSPVFSNLPALTSIAEGASNRSVFDVSTWTTGTIKSNLFESCPKLATLKCVLYGATGLTSVPSNLLANLPALATVDRAFQGCSNLTATIDLTGSDSIKSATYFGSSSSITVKVTKGSTTDTTMQGSSANVTVTY